MRNCKRQKGNKAGKEQHLKGQESNCRTAYRLEHSRQYAAIEPSQSLRPVDAGDAHGEAGVPHLGSSGVSERALDDCELQPLLCSVLQQQETNVSQAQRGG